ncbi:MAG: helix-turn-helix transcriptional regulator [Clostridia bacterium]|nr:helix-turn-helix transcriptional regulator [Clostridia bacterium]
MFGKNITDYRTERGLSQKELAQKVGVSQGAIYFWEKEINEPTVRYIIKLAEVFGVSVDELLSFEPKNNAGNSAAVDMMVIFNRLSESQQNLLLSVAKEFLLNKN